ncbi:hypothetical protein BH20ACI4_BH20ACI4_15710 [soil metagenome]
MERNEKLAELTAEDITKIKHESMGFGCLTAVAVPALLILLAFSFVTGWNFSPMQTVLVLAIFVGIPVLLLILLYKYIKKKKKQVEKDIAGGQKKIIIAPITNKRIKSSDITGGRNKGGIKSEYFMTIAGRDYPMTEHKYLKIPVGEFMEIHLAPATKTVLRERWLKKDGTFEEENEDDF